MHVTSMISVNNGPQSQLVQRKMLAQAFKKWATLTKCSNQETKCESYTHLNPRELGSNEKFGVLLLSVLGMLGSVAGNNQFSNINCTAVTLKGNSAGAPESVDSQCMQDANEVLQKQCPDVAAELAGRDVTADFLKQVHDNLKKFPLIIFSCVWNPIGFSTHISNTNSSKPCSSG